MKLIKQKHRADCAIAAIAMVTGTTYTKVAQTVFPGVKPRDIKGTSMIDALKAIEKLKVKFEITFEKLDLMKLKQSAYISVTMPSGIRHAIVWDHQSKRILNPGVKKITKAYAKKHMNFAVKIIPS